MGQGGDGDVPMLDQHFAYQSGVRNMALAKRCDGHGDGGGGCIRDVGDKSCNRSRCGLLFW